MIHHVLIGWCSIHALIYLALATAVFWLAQLAVQVRAERQPKQPPRPSNAAPRLPHWARTGHLPVPPPSSAAQGRHRRGETR